MKVPAPEVLLALRAPNAGWLAALICALDEAHRDPGFSAAQRDLVHRLLDADHLPLNVVGAAHERLARFEAALLAGFEAENAEVSVEASRPKLTLCVASA